MIALDLDGTLLGEDARISSANQAALAAASRAGIDIVIATGRRHSYAMKVLRGAGMPEGTTLVTSNGAVVRGFDSHLIETTFMPTEVASWLCGHLGDFRNALVITFDRVGPDGDDTRGALVVEQLEDLNSSIGRWMEVNSPYIAVVKPIEDALHGPPPIQMMLCGTVERMRRAESLMLEDARVSGIGEVRAAAQITLNRTEYPERDLSIVDILPGGCSKGAALLRLAAARGIDPSALMAIGDNWNDVSMLEIAGHPVLMQNAPEDLLPIAAAKGWQLTGSNLDDGVAQAITRVLAKADAHFLAVPSLQ